VSAPIAHSPFLSPPFLFPLRLNNLSSIQQNLNFKFIKGDILSPDLLMYVLETEQIDTVMHFAAQTHVDNSFGNSLAFTMNNTYGTHVLLEACRNYGKIKRFVNVSTDEVYGETSLGSQHGLNETSRLEPTNPYSAAKAGAEMMAMAYFTSYGMPVITTRGNNVYGPHQVRFWMPLLDECPDPTHLGPSRPDSMPPALTDDFSLDSPCLQFPEKMIPKFSLLASQGRSLPLHGDGMAVRSYLYVEDVAEAFDVILHRGLPGETYNIGTKKERTVKEVAQEICGKFGLDPAESVEHVRDRAFNDQRYFISDDKLQALGWKERTQWKDGLSKTIDWYLKEGGVGIDLDRRAPHAPTLPRSRSHALTRAARFARSPDSGLLGQRRHERGPECPPHVNAQARTVVAVHFVTDRHNIIRDKSIIRSKSIKVRVLVARRLVHLLVKALPDGARQALCRVSLDGRRLDHDLPAQQQLFHRRSLKVVTLAQLVEAHDPFARDAASERDDARQHPHPQLFHEERRLLRRDLDEPRLEVLCGQNLEVPVDNLAPLKVRVPEVGHDPVRRRANL